MKAAVLATLALVSLLTGSAFADLQYANTVAVTGNATFTFTNVNNATGAPDGAFLTISKSTTTVATVTVRGNFSEPFGQDRLFLFTGDIAAGATATVVAVRVFDADGNMATHSPGTALVANAPNVFAEYNSVNYSNFASLGAPVAVRFDINLGTVTGDLLEIDAIANPEPGSLALFGLGAAACAGWVVKRRRNRRATPARAA